MGVFILSKRNPLQEIAWRLFGKYTGDVNGQWNEANIIEKNSLLRTVMDVFEFSGVPDGWDVDYMKYNLLMNGFFCITDTTVGVVPLRCGVTGHNIYDRPNSVIVANDILGNFERKIGVDCALVKLQYLYEGLENVFDLYAYLLASCDASIAVNMMNTRVTFIAEASSQAQEKAMKKMYDEIAYGKPAVFTRTGGVGNHFFLNPKQSYIASDIHLMKRNIRNEFKSLFGIYNVNQDKKERLIEDEIMSSNNDVLYNIGHFIDNINTGFEVANRLYELNLRCRRKEYGGAYGSNVDQPDTV